MSKRTRNAEVARRYAGSEPLTVIAADYGITPQRVAQIALRAGAPPRNRVRRVEARDARRAQIQALLAAHGPLPLKTLAWRLGVSVSAVSQDFLALGLRATRAEQLRERLDRLRENA